MHEILVLTDGNLEERLLESPRPLLVECWAPGCKPCRSQGAVIEKMMARGALDVRVGRLDAQSNPEAAAYFDLRAVPCLLLLRSGVVIERAIGLQSAEEIEALLRQGREGQRRAS